MTYNVFGGIFNLTQSKTKSSISNGMQLLVILVCLTRTTAVFFSLEVTSYEDQMHSNTALKVSCVYLSIIGSLGTL